MNPAFAPSFGGPRPGGPGFGGPGGPGGPGFGGPGGPGFGGPFKGRLLRPAVLLLDGPATAAELVERISQLSQGEFSPPQNKIEKKLEFLAEHGAVEITNGVATLTERGRKRLAMRGITKETAQALRTHVLPRRLASHKIRAGLAEFAGVARVIALTGTDEQKDKLAETQKELLAAIVEAKQSLHSTLN